MQYTETTFEITVPRKGKYEIHCTCDLLFELTKLDEQELINVSSNFGVDKSFLRTLTSVIAARRRNVDILLNHTETELNFLTLDREGSLAYRAAVGKIHKLLTYLDTMDKGIGLAFEGNDVESFFIRQQPMLFVPPV